MANRIRSGKDRPFAGRSFIFLEQVDSTNSYILRNQELLNTPGLVVYAGRQSSGRGRSGRQWFSRLDGNLYASIVVHPRLPQSLLTSMTLLAGYSVFETIGEFGIEGLSIKWPNDILVHERKICGILCESRPICDQDLVAVVVGIGLNIRGRPENFPAPLCHVVTTLEAEGIRADREEILNRIVSKFDQILEEVHTKGPNRIFDAWQRASSSIGRPVWFEHNGRLNEGWIKGLDGKGALLVSTKDGSIIKVISGEVRYRD